MESAFDTIFTDVFYRKAYHFAGGVCLFLAFRYLPTIAVALSCLVYLFLFRLLARRISLALLGALLLFALTRSRFAVLGSVVVFTLGDGLATVVGSAYGSTPLPWNRKKSIAGSLAYLIAASAGMAAYVPLAAPVSLTKELALVVFPSLAGAITESLPLTQIRDRKPDDNLTSILAVGLLLWVLQGWFSIPPVPWAMNPR